MYLVVHERSKTLHTTEYQQHDDKIFFFVFLQAMKRLMTHCQTYFPTDPSRSVDYDVQLAKASSTNWLCILHKDWVCILHVHSNTSISCIIIIMNLYIERPELTMESGLYSPTMKWQYFISQTFIYTEIHHGSRMQITLYDVAEMSSHHQSSIKETVCGLQSRVFV